MRIIGKRYSPVDGSGHRRGIRRRPSGFWNQKRRVHRGQVGTDPVLRVQRVAARTLVAGQLLHDLVEFRKLFQKHGVGRGRRRGAAAEVEAAEDEADELEQAEQHPDAAGQLDFRKIALLSHPDVRGRRLRGQHDTGRGGPAAGRHPEDQSFEIHAESGADHARRIPEPEGKCPPT